MKSRSVKAPSLLSAIDIITIVFCSWIVGYLTLGFARAHDPLIHIPIYSSIIAGVFLLAYWDRSLDAIKRPRLKRILAFVRGIYPVTMFGYFFISSYSVNRILFGDFIDPWFYNIDHAIFGYYPSMVWGMKYSQVWISELFHGAYFCYYPMIAGLPLYFYFKKPEAFKEVIFSLTFAFYMYYFLYSLLPVVGGRFFPEAMAQTKVYWGGPFTHIMAFIYNESHHLGGAFPSSHVGITIVLTMSALKHVRKVGYLFVVIAFFLSLATVYCHYHWFIDMVAGVLTGIGGFYLAQYVRQKIQGRLNA